MKPGGVFSELYVLKKLLFCFVNSGFDVPIRIIEFFGQLFISPAIEQAAFQYGSVCFVENPQVYQLAPFCPAEVKRIRSHNVITLHIDENRTHWHIIHNSHRSAVIPQVFLAALRYHCRRR